MVAWQKLYSPLTMSSKLAKAAARGGGRTGHHGAAVAGSSDYPGRAAPAARKGHFALYTRDGRRFVIPISYLNSAVFRELLRRSEEEFGLPRGDRPITLPCDGAFMEHVVASLKDVDLAAWNLKIKWRI